MGIQAGGIHLEAASAGETPVVKSLGLGEAFPASLGLGVLPQHCPACPALPMLGRGLGLGLGWYLSIPSPAVVPQHPSCRGSIPQPERGT